MPCGPCLSHVATTGQRQDGARLSVYYAILYALRSPIQTRTMRDDHRLGDQSITIPDEIKSRRLGWVPYRAQVWRKWNLLYDNGWQGDRNRILNFALICIYNVINFWADSRYGLFAWMNMILAINLSFRSKRLDNNWWLTQIVRTKTVETGWDRFGVHLIFNWNTKFCTIILFYETNTVYYYYHNLRSFVLNQSLCVLWLFMVIIDLLNLLSFLFFLREIKFSSRASE